MPTTTTTGLANFEMTLNHRAASASQQDWVETVVHQARKTDWDAVIAGADKAISIAGAAVLIASVLYFAPILTSLLTAHP